jgi:hypothetical protein
LCVVGLQPIGLDFLGASPVRRESPVYRLLDFLGFPWNLSSESRLFNGLRGINRQKFFVTLLSVAAAAPQRRSHSCHADKQDRSSGKLTLTSDFQQ